MNTVLRPELLWIEGRCYRMNEPVGEISALQEHDLYEDDLELKNEDDEDQDDKYEVVMLDNNRFCSNFHVSKHYLGSIIGKKGATKCRIERDTRTDIKIPRHGENKDIAIYGPSVSNVKAARRRIDNIVMSSRMKQKPTHFLSIPMNQPSIMNTFETFKEKVLHECKGEGLEESLFIKPSKLHLTLGVMCLMDNEERILAYELLSGAKEKIIMPILRNYLPLKIRIKGLSYMNDDPSAIHVLYGCVQVEGAPADLLQRVADALVDHYYHEGFMNREHGRENVKLHVTFLNSKYRLKSSAVHEEPISKNGRTTFDGTEIFKKFADYDFGVMELTEIHLSQRNTMSTDGYYQPTCVISCNE